MVNNGNGGRFAGWVSSGKLATVGWFLVLGLYCYFRGALRIEDPSLGQAFLVLTGGWVGFLTLAMNKKNVKAEEKADDAADDIETLKARIEQLEADR